MLFRARCLLCQLRPPRDFCRKLNVKPAWAAAISYLHGRGRQLRNVFSGSPRLGVGTHNLRIEGNRQKGACDVPTLILSGDFGTGAGACFTLVFVPAHIACMSSTVTQFTLAYFSLCFTVHQSLTIPPRNYSNFRPCSGTVFALSRNTFSVPLPD